MWSVKDVLEIVLGGIGTVFLGLISWGLKKWIMTTFENTVAVKHLTESLKEVKEQISEIPRLKKGMAILFDKLNDTKTNGGIK